MIDPAQLADQGAELSGELPVTSMPRLAELCLDHRGSVIIDLKFGRDGVGGLRFMRGRLQAELRLVCQRCLEPMTLRFEIEPNWIVLRPGERPELEQQDDTVVAARALPLAELVEDDLLLAMPMISMHALAECPAQAHVRREATTGPKRPNPFAELKAPKPRGKKE